MPEIFTEGTRDAEWLISEANYWRSRDEVVIAASQTLVTGAVLGRVTANDEFVELNPAAVDGSEVAAAILIHPATTAAGETVKRAVVARDAEVVDDLLVFAAGVDATERAAAVAELAALGIVARSAFSTPA